MSIINNGYKFVQLKNLKTLIDLIKDKITTKSLKVDKEAVIGKNTTINDNNGIKTHKISVGNNTISSTESKFNKLTITSIENDDKTISINNEGVKTNRLTANEAEIVNLNFDAFINDNESSTDKTYSSSKIIKELNKATEELKESITAEIEKEKERAMTAEEELRNTANNIATEPMNLDF